VPAVAQQPVVYGGGLRTKPVQQTAGNGIPLGTPLQTPPRPVAVFATPFPTRPTPGPVTSSAFTEPAPQQRTQAPQAQPVASPRPGGAATPGAAGKVMYFHKAEGAAAVDGPPDNSTLAMASPPVTIPAVSTPDVSVAPVGVPRPVVVPNTVIEKPIVPPTLDPVPAQPFNPTPVVSPLPAFPTSAQSEQKKDEPKKDGPKVEPKKDLLPPEVTRLPPRESIFTIYDTAKLEGVIYESIGGQLKKTAQEMKAQFPFPDVAPVVPPGTQYVSKTTNLAPSKLMVEPGFVIHRRLHFEEKNSERYGWDLGLMTPFVSTASFYKNILLWPSSLATSVVIGEMDTNKGKCLPGSPTPYYLYPQGLTITGGVAEGLVITGLSFVIP
jgi:hypothetical protein